MPLYVIAGGGPTPSLYVVQPGPPAANAQIVSTIVGPPVFPNAAPPPPYPDDLPNGYSMTGLMDAT